MENIKQKQVPLYEIFFKFYFHFLLDMLEVFAEVRHKPS